MKTWWKGFLEKCIHFHFSFFIFLFCLAFIFFFFLDCSALKTEIKIICHFWNVTDSMKSLFFNFRLLLRLILEKFLYNLSKSLQHSNSFLKVEDQTQRFLFLDWALILFESNHWGTKWNNSNRMDEVDTQRVFFPTDGPVFFRQTLLFFGIKENENGQG